MAGEGEKGGVGWSEFDVVEEKDSNARNLRGVLEVSCVRAV
jgi:hypothetical protein